MSERAVAITVLMPAFNAARWLEAALSSVLAQTGPSFELLIVDDGSTDDTPARLSAIRDARVRCIRLPHNQGLIIALNRGLAEARGELVARLDADDLCRPGRLALQYAALSADPDAVMVTGSSELIAEDGAHVGWSRWRFGPEAYYYLLHFRNCIAHSTVMFRRAAVLDAGGYREAYRRAEDFELWGRVARRGKILSLPADLVAYRFHGASVSVREASAQADMAAQIARERLGRLLAEPVADSLAHLYSERAFARGAGDLRCAADQFVRAQSAIWQARPRYCREPILEHFMLVEWGRRAISFARRGFWLELPPHFARRAFTLSPLFEGGLRGLLEELRIERLSALMPRTHP